MKNNLAKNIIILVLLTILLKGIGFINRIIIAYYFGTTVVTDVYYNASGFMDSISSIVLASLSVGIINVYLSNRENGSKRDNDKFISNLLIICFFGMCLISIISSVFRTQLSSILAPAYSKQNKEVLADMVRMMSITLPFQGAIAVYSALLQAEQRFTPVKIIGTITSIISIVSVVLLTRYFGINSLVISYIVAIIFNALFLGFNSRKLFKFSFEKLKIDNNFKKLFVIVAPVAIGIAAHEINLIVDKSIASGLEEGAISALSYSCVLYLFVENVIINSIVTAFLPNLTEKVLKKEENDVANSTKSVLACAEVILIPIVIVTFFFSDVIIKIVYMRGNFNQQSLMLTEAALKGYILGLPFLAIRDISMRVYYAYGDTKTPLKVNASVVLVNIILDIILSKYFGLFGITIATSISSIISGVILLISLKKYNENILNAEMVKFFIQEIVVAALLCIISLICKDLLGNIYGFVVTFILLLTVQVLLLLIFRNSLFKAIYNSFILKINKSKER